tara:strand:- start:2840 stop:3748 length:909 start_codon:yes stop_codon:yes gene_type:complete
MLDPKIFKLIMDRDFIAMSPLELRPFMWASLQAYDSPYVRARMQEYNSKFDLIHWMSFWTEKERVISPFDGKEKYEKFKKKSSEAHQKVFKYLFDKEILKKKLHFGYDIYNAIDYYIISQNCDNFNVTLDFGSGYGRLAAMFSFKENQKTFISVDCIESTYILQNLFLSLLKPQNFHEYFDYEFLNKKINIKQKNSIFHIPTWRMNIVENESVDLITSVFVLPEINEFALNNFITESKRILKKNGFIYVRDHLYQTGEKNHKGAHKLNTEKELRKNGFELIFKCEYKDNVDIYGTPRIYKKI